MWNSISSEQDLSILMSTVCAFHDSCIKEIKYTSGAYVDNDLTMYPVNDLRALKMIIQRQFDNPSAIELEFLGLKYFRLSPCDEQFDNMTGIDFEYFCADLLKKNNFINVSVTQKSADHGIDIFAEKDDISYAIQCKCYSSNIGNAAIQQAHTGKCIFHKDIAVVLTNQYFTAQAITEAEALGVKLWDRNKLQKMLHYN